MGMLWVVQRNNVAIGNSDDLLPTLKVQDLADSEPADSGAPELEKPGRAETSGGYPVFRWAGLMPFISGKWSRTG